MYTKPPFPDYRRSVWAELAALCDLHEAMTRQPELRRIVTRDMAYHYHKGGAADSAALVIYQQRIAPFRGRPPPG